jgi:glycosyltransferase involved in cell wall biosynthesis
MAAGVAPSEPTANAWRQLRWPEKRLHVAPNWVDTTRFAPCDQRTARRRTLNLDEQTPLVVYVGRITQEKGIETLVRAYAGTLKYVPEAKLVLVGNVEAEYRQKVDELTQQLGLTPEQVLWPGTTDRPEHYQSVADVIVVPSQWDEPFGLALIEAMACGTVTIASSAGILPQIIGDQNRDLVFPAGDVKALEARLAWWLKHPVEAGLRGTRLRERTMTAFSPSRSVDVYERLLVEASGGQLNRG